MQVDVPKAFKVMKSCTMLRGYSCSGDGGLYGKERMICLRNGLAFALFPAGKFFLESAGRKGEVAGFSTIKRGAGCLANMIVVWRDKHGFRFRGWCC